VLFRSQGDDLSEALRKHAPRVLPKSFLGILAIGEKSGQIREALKIIDSGYEDYHRIKTKATTVLLYPGLTVFVSLMVVVFLLMRVVPTFQEIFSDLNTPLPRLTEALLSLSAQIRTNIVAIFIFVLVGLIAIISAIRLAKKSPAVNRYLLFIPFFGPALYHLNLLRFSVLLSMLLKVGTPIDEALSLCEGDAMWPVFASAVKHVRRDVSGGKALSEALKKQAVFSPTFVWFASNGEHRGNLADSLKSAGEFETAIFQDHLERLRLVEPTCAIITGVVVGLIVIAMALPIMQMPNLLL